MLLRERINEIRQTKHIPIERFVRNGISKNKYYRFVSGEGSVSIGDLQKIIEILTVSLSELVAESDERDSLIFNEFGDYWQLSLPELRERASVFAHRYMQTQMKAHYIASTVYELLAGRKAGEDISDYVDELYKELKRQRFFTIFDLQVFRILMPQLNVA
ncbi:helix-turn-helix transcriptional regulator, partial [Weissella sp. DD23]